MFEERLTPFQKNLIEHLDDTARKPRQVREMLRDVAGKIVDAPPKGQIGLMGLEPLTKEGIVYATINKQREDIGEPAFQVTTAAPTGKELEEPDTGRTESAGRLGQSVGLGAGEDTGLAARTSIQVGLAGLGKEAAQVKMLEEFGGAPGAAGKKETLIDVEAEKAREAAKPLPGQIALKEVKVKPRKVTKKKPIVQKHTMAELRNRHAMRSPAARLMDENQSHQITIDNKSPRVKTWITNPGRADITGVDTPRISKGTKRITPKTPRLRR